MIRKILRAAHQLRAKIKGFCKGVVLCLLVKVLEKVFKKKVIIINLIEHLGDIVACEPIVSYARTELGATYVIWCIKPQFSEAIRSNPSINLIYPLNCITEWIYAKNYLHFNNIIDLHIEGRTCFSCRKKLTKVGNNKQITLENYYNYGPILVSFAKENRITISEEVQPTFHIKNDLNISTISTADYIVIHRQSNEQCRNWPRHKWIEMINFLLSETQFIVVEVGAGDDALAISHSRFVSKVGKTSISESASIIKNCYFFIGIDSSMAHIANAFQKPALILLGSYRVFASYLPYTGHYFKNKKFILSHPGSLEQLTVEAVTNRLKSLI